MRLRFSRKGRQFFFFTFCVEGRAQMLSSLAAGPAVKGRGTKSPAPLDGGGNALAHAELLPPGEAVLRWLLALHGENPALAVSNRVVMPDHVHFLLVVDFNRDPAFDPLAFAHRFRREAGRETGGAGASPVPWERPFWLALSLSARQLSAIRRYIRGNPARALWKKAHPDRFRVMSGIRHPSLDPSVAWSAMGDPTLLASPFRFPVRLTRKLPPEAQEPALAAAVERARSGMVPVCGFLSPAERELERRLRAEPSARWIKVVPHGLPANHDPSQEDSRALAEGRMLLLSSFSPEVPASPISRANCETMNDRIFALCGEAADPIRTGVSGTSFGVVTPDNFESFLSPSSFCKTTNERTMP